MNPTRISNGDIYQINRLKRKNFYLEETLREPSLRTQERHVFGQTNSLDLHRNWLLFQRMRNVSL